MRRPQPSGWGHYLFTFVFSTGRHTAPNVSFLFVQIQNLANLRIKFGVMLLQSELQILMYR